MLIFENIIDDVQNKGNGEINTAYHNFSKKRNLIVYKLKGLKKVSMNPTTVD